MPSGFCKGGPYDGEYKSEAENWSMRSGKYEWKTDHWVWVVPKRGRL